MSEELLPRPVARMPIAIRVAGMDDLAFIDALQKQSSRDVGFLQRKALESYIERGDVLIAERRHEGTEARRHEGVEDGYENQASGIRQANAARSQVSDTKGRVPNAQCQMPNASPLGYLIGRDTYYKREDVGIIYQVNILPEARRHLVGAKLVEAMFERAAWGCKLFCAWCAQDLPANRFWEALGFRPLAFRTGSAEKARRHIFWQKRIRIGDTTTRWWFPSRTASGMVREDRLVLPIPPGTHWSEAKPMVLPGPPEGGIAGALPGEDVRMLPAEGEDGGGERKSSKTRGKMKKTDRESAQPFAAVRAGEVISDPMDPRLNQPFFETAADREAKARAEAEAKAREKEERKKRRRREKKVGGRRVYDPRFVKAAREICARFLEELDGPGGERLIPAGDAEYEVGRLAEAGKDAGGRLEAIDAGDGRRLLPRAA